MNYFIFFKVLKKLYVEFGFLSLVDSIIKSILIKLRVNVQFLIFSFRPSFSNKKFVIKKDEYLFDYKSNFIVDPSMRKKYMKNDFNFLGNNFLDYVDEKTNRKKWINQHINVSNRKLALDINEALVSKSYDIKSKKLVKWNYDHLSGYYWSNKVYSPYLKVPYGKGLDVKIPWEISRLQHLSKLVLMGLHEKKKEIEIKIYSRTFSQLFDFLISNPPRFGINWKSTMEVAIRGANISIIADVLKKNFLDNDQINLLYNSVYDHMKFVIENLEWSKLSTSNHYISNIISLIVMANFLPSNKYNIGVLSFAYNQLFNEIRKQFYNDGGNKEGSTGYHIFTNEMILIGLYFFKKNPVSKITSTKNIKSIFNKVAQILRCSQKLDPSLEDQVYEKLQKINYFSSICLRNDKSMIQIGDNDSGCFFPYNINNKNEEQKYLHKNIIETRSNIPFFCYLNRRDIKINSNVGLNNNNNFNFISLKKKIEKLDMGNKKFFHIKFPKKISVKNIRFHSFSDFGLYSFINEDFSLFITCKSNYNFFSSGHLHDDNLGIDLVVNKIPIVTDPGSYCYSRDIKIRSLYKGPKSHFVPRTLSMIKPIDKDEPFFYSKKSIKGECVFINKNNFLGKITHKGTCLYRWLKIRTNGLDILDFSENEKLYNYDIFDAKHFISNNYGRQTNKGIVKKEMFNT